MADRQGAEHAAPKPRWNVERRLAFIDFRLFWDGRINRGDLVDFFEISVPQASADLSQYQAAAPSNVTYDTSGKSYVATAHFRPTFFEPSSDQYLAKLRLLASGFLKDEDVPIVEPPNYSAVPLLRRCLSPDILRRVLEAIRCRSQLHVEYQSVSSDEPVWRWIAPHALGFDGFRWHARAWCLKHGAFRDFVLARIRRTGPARPFDVRPELDQAWLTEITFKIAPHPDLSPGLRRAIELDYGMEQGFVGIKTRACMAFYLERNLGLDEESTRLSPERQQVILINRDEVERVRRETEAAPSVASEETGPQ